MGADEADLGGLYDDLGPRDGPPAVLVHGALLDRGTWAPQHALAAKRRLLAPDLPRHGRHRPSAAPLTVEACARFVLAVMDHAGLDRASLVGFSFGGLVAQRLTELAPHRVEGLVLYACPLLAHFPGLRAPDLAARLATADTHVRSWAAVRRSFAAKCADLPAARQDVLRAAQVTTVGDYRDIFKAMAHAVRDEPGHRFPVPSAYIFGDRDHGFTDVPALARAYRAHEPQGRVVAVPGARHCAHWEAPQRFNAELDQTLTLLAHETANATARPTR